MNINHLAAIVLLALFAPLSWAGGESGGGKIIKEGSQYFLYDFFESGIDDTNVYLSPPSEDTIQARLRVSTVLTKVEPEVVEIVVNKLLEINSKVPHLADIFITTFEEYFWVVANKKLAKTYDVGTTPFQNSDGFVWAQAARRDDHKKVVWFDDELWSHLSDAHKAGLIFHEVIYAVATTHNKYHNDGSYSSRLLNAFFFSPIFKTRTPEQVIKRAEFISEKKLLTPEEYAYYISEKYASDCNSFRSLIETNVIQFWQDLSPTLQTINQRAVIKDLKDRHFRNFVYPSLMSLEIQSQQIYYPSSNYKLAEKIYAAQYTKSHCYDKGCGVEHLYSLSSREKKKLTNISAQALKLHQQSEKQFFGHCLESKLDEALENYSRFSVDKSGKGVLK